MSTTGIPAPADAALAGSAVFDPERLSAVAAFKQQARDAAILSHLGAGSPALAGRVDGGEKTPDQRMFDRYTRLAVALLDSPVALFSVVDDREQWFAGNEGFCEDATDLDHSYCAFVVATDEPLVIGDSSEHDLLRNHPATTEFDISAYAGMPVRDAHGNVLGSLCVIDHQPREWSAEQLELLSDLVASLESEVALRGLTTELEERLADERADYRLRERFFTSVAGTNGVQSTVGALLRSGPATVEASAVSLALRCGNEVTFYHSPGMDDRVASSWTTVPLNAPVPLAHSCKTGETVRLASRSEFDDWPVMVDDADVLDLQSWISLPLVDGLGNVFGALGIGWTEPLTRKFPAGVKKFASLSSDALQRAIGFDRERESARMLEQLILPTSLYATETLDVAAAYVPPSASQRVGGDLYDVLPCDDGVAIVIADAVGHDITATKIAGKVRYAIGSLLTHGLSPAEVMTGVNRYLLRVGFSYTQMATCSIALIDTVNHTVTVANAGHPASRLIRADGAVETVEVNGDPVLGVSDHDYRQTSCAFEDGDLYIAFTDGLVERRDRPLDQQFRRLDDVLGDLASSETSLAAIVDQIVDEVVAGDEVEDDIAIVAARLPLA